MRIVRNWRVGFFRLGARAATFGRREQRLTLDKLM